MPAGVCTAVADDFGLDLTLVPGRLGCPLLREARGVLAYLVAWVIPVKARRARSPRTSLARSTTPGQADGDLTGFQPIVKPPP